MPRSQQVSLTIGDLARRFGMAPSALRFYEERGLLEPEGRTRAGYRLYGKKAERTLQLIQRAQRIGFSLADIAALLEVGPNKDAGDSAIAAVAEQRLVALQKQLTDLMVLQHELELFVRDVRKRHEQGRRTKSRGHTLDDLLARVCDHDHVAGSPGDTLEALLARAGVKLSAKRAEELVAALRGQHIHIWREHDGYTILLASDAPAVERALTELTQADADRAPTSAVTKVPEGLRFEARGDNAFLFAHFFLVLERAAGRGRG